MHRPAVLLVVALALAAVSASASAEDAPVAPAAPAAPAASAPAAPAPAPPAASFPPPADGAKPAPADAPVPDALSGGFATVTIANQVARVVISTQRASIDRFDLLHSHPIDLPDALRKRAVPRIEERSAEERTKPLSVLGPFYTDDPKAASYGANRHNWLFGFGLDGTASRPWQVLSQGADRAVLGFLVPEEPGSARGLVYEMTYVMDPVRPTVRSTLVVRNTGAKAATFAAKMALINGIHQDYPVGESYYLTGAFHHGGPNGKLETIGFPDVNPRPGPGARPSFTPFPTDKPVDYLAVKSRFFAALWTPGAFVIAPEPAALAAPADPAQPAPAEGPAATANEGPGAGAAPATASDARWSAGLYRFPWNFPIAQATLQVVYDREVVLPPNTRLTTDWGLTVTSMKKGDLLLLNEAERRVQYTDGMYKFFKLLANLLTWFLGLIVLVVQNYGVALIVLTFLLKAALHRTTFKQQESMMKMQKLAPELKYLQEQYKGDKQKLAVKQMELWKKHGVNPLGGCLPALIQMPMFMALYQAFTHSADMRGERFLWVNDLTLPDQLWYLGFGIPNWVPLLGDVPITINPLPLMYIAVTVWMSMTMKLPPSSDPQQEQMQKMMRWLPVVFGIIFYNMPAGLVLYFTANAIIGTIEIKMVKKKLGIA